MSCNFLISDCFLMISLVSLFCYLDLIEKICLLKSAQMHQFYLLKWIKLYLKKKFSFYYIRLWKTEKSQLNNHEYTFFMIFFFLKKSSKIKSTNYFLLKNLLIKIKQIKISVYICVSKIIASNINIKTLIIEMIIKK